MKVSSNRLPPGTYGEHGEFISFEGDPAMLSRGYRDYLEQHFAADEFEHDRPEWAELETSTEDLQQQGPTDKELRVVWGALKSGKAAGADDCPREAYETASEALDDFLYLVAACIHQQRFPPMVALVMFVLLYKGSGDICDLARHRAIQSQESEQLETSVASDERAGEVAQTRMESTESQPDDDDDMSAASAAFEDDSNNIGVQERQELFNEGVALGFQLGYAAALDQATSSEAAATTSQTTTGNLVEDTLQSPGALTGRRVPLYARSGEGKRASASGLVETSASAELAQSDGDPLGGDLGEDAGPARLDGDES
jgi:hypothetical protein